MDMVLDTDTALVSVMDMEQPEDIPQTVPQLLFMEVERGLKLSLQDLQ